MKRSFLFVFVTLFCVSMFAAQGGTLTTDPTTPIDPTATVTIIYDGGGTNFANWEPRCFIHAWLVPADGETFSKSYGTEWINCGGESQYDAIESKRKMTYAGVEGAHDGRYTISINIQSFFDVEDDDLSKIAQIGIIVCTQWVANGDDNKTNDMFLDVNQVSGPVETKYYLVGSEKGWNPAAENLLSADSENEGQYYINTTIVEGEGLKVLKVEGPAKTYLPEGMDNEYIVDALHAGEKTIYFKPAKGEGWTLLEGYIWIDANSTTAIENAVSGGKAYKIIENGQLLIIKNGVRYNALGSELK